MADITMEPVEAYGMESAYMIPDGWHTFIVNKSKTIEWKNFGGGWKDPRRKELVAETHLYLEWACEFVAPTPVPKTDEVGKKDIPVPNLGMGGIEFAVNGVCHTIANRILAIADSDADVRAAKGDHHAVFFFGKYGFGLKQFVGLVEKAHRDAAEKYTIPAHALDAVKNRIKDYIDSELLAWRYIAQEVIKIPVDDLLRKNIQGGIAEARRRLQAYIDEREKLYKKYQEDHHNKDTLHKEIKAAILKHGGSYLEFLRDIGYITEQEKKDYLRAAEAFLNKFIQAVENLASAVQGGQLL